MWAEDRRYGVAGRFRVVRCRSCGLVYVNPRPDPASLGRYYPESYGPHQERAQHADPAGDLVRRLAFAGGLGVLGEPIGWLYNSVAFRAFARRTSRGRVLDVGCGPGHYLGAWQRLGWDVEGIEPNRQVAERASQALGAPVHTGFVEELTLESGRYDVVTMSHSLEHVRSPSAVLAQLRTSLRPGGRLIAMVPNFAAWDRRLFTEAWYGLEVPRHLYHFEPRTLRALLEKSGFTVERMGGSAHPHAVVASVNLLLGRPLRAESSRVTSALMTALLLPAAILRRSTSLWVVARAA